MLFCLCMPALLHAQRDDSKYLAGAVPEVDGKVVFTKDFSIPGMSQDTIYSRLLRWMDARLAKNGNNSRVVFSDKEKGQIVGIGDEWIVFSSTALSLDRTKILYQLTVTCQPEKCVFGFSVTGNDNSLQCFRRVSDVFSGKSAIFRQIPGHCICCCIGLGCFALYQMGDGFGESFFDAG